MMTDTPIYIIEESKLRRNLKLIASVAAKADIEIILAFKAFALWKTFPIFREYIHSTTASSLSEAKMAFEKFGAPAHTYLVSSTRLSGAHLICRSTRYLSMSVSISVPRPYRSVCA